jgi:hypothetical protein
MTHNLYHAAGTLSLTRIRKRADVLQEFILTFKITDADLPVHLDLKLAVTPEAFGQLLHDDDYEHDCSVTGTATMTEEPPR